jgi:hypothetical protein
MATKYSGCNSGDGCLECAELLTSSLNWAMTREGHAYWKVIYQRLLEFGQIKKQNREIGV